MKRPIAWMVQAVADLESAQRMYARKVANPAAWRVEEDCQVAAKCQQCIEKAMKAVIDKLHEAGLSKTAIDGKHPVARYVRTMQLLAASSPKRSAIAQLAKSFSPGREAAIQQLDLIVPAFAKPPALARRNTEYPYQDAAGDWRAPAAIGSFTDGEVRRWYTTAWVVAANLRKALAALNLAYP